MTEPLHDPQNDLLSAYLDGELEESAQAAVVVELQNNPQARQLLEEMRSARAALRTLPQAQVPGDLLEDIMAAAERQALLSQAGTTSISRQRWSGGVWRAAAMVVFLVGGAGGWVYWQMSRQTINTSVPYTTVALNDSTDKGITGETGVDREIVGGELLAKGGPKSTVMPEGGHSLSKSAPPAPTGAAGKSALPIEQTEKQVTGKEATGAVQQQVQVAQGPEEPTSGRRVINDAEDQKQDLPFSAMKSKPVDAAAGSGSKQAAAVPSPMADQLVQSLDKDQVNLELLSNNVNELTLRFDDPEQLLRFERDSAVYLNDRRDFNFSIPLEQKSETGNRSLILRQRLKEPAGSAPVNTVSQRYLVQASPKAIEVLLDRYDQAVKIYRAADEPQVELRLGAKQVQGLDASRTEIQLLNDPQRRADVLKSTPENSLFFNTAPNLAATDVEQNSVTDWEYYYQNLVPATASSSGPVDNDAAAAESQAVQDSTDGAPKLGTRLEKVEGPPKLGAGRRYRQQRAGEPQDAAPRVGEQMQQQNRRRGVTNATTPYSNSTQPRWGYRQNLPEQQITLLLELRTQPASPTTTQATTQPHDDE
ncbi:MAG: hypothetical protein HJJLKODD_00493 [Phycisphaerae bacterium]|nr:hypothetical protein [Phycisphaerae bacterium]